MLKRVEECVYRLNCFYGYEAVSIEKVAKKMNLSFQETSRLLAELEQEDIVTVFEDLRVIHSKI